MLSFSGKILVALPNEIFSLPHYHIYRIKSPPELVPQIVGEMKRKFKVSSHRYADANKPHD